jgi:adenylate cyclase
VRGSTALGEGLPPAVYSQILNRFYGDVSEVLMRTDAFIDKFVGDEVMGIFLPIFAGNAYAQQAVRAAEEILAKAYTSQESELSIGVGVHTGSAFFGTVSGAGGVFSDFTALGDTVNVAARLVSAAAPGEALISESTCTAAGLDTSTLEQRVLEVRGRSDPIGVRVLLRPSPTLAET